MARSSDRPDRQPTAPPVGAPDTEVELDVEAFLPEGVTLADPGGTTPDPDPAAHADPDDRPAPELPAWARDDDPADGSGAGSVDGEPSTELPPADSAVVAPAAASPAPVTDDPRPPDLAPAGPDDEVDLGRLTAIEHDLRAVEEAMAAVDRGEPEASPLLGELLAEDRRV